MELIECATRSEWLDARRRGIGASDAAVILGVSKWKSPLQLYAEKAGLLDTPESEREELEWGHRLEPVIAKKYEDETGRVTEDPGDYAITVGVQPWLLATLDRTVKGNRSRGVLPIEQQPKTDGVLELKNAIEFRRDEWDEEPPLMYQIQLQHQLAVTGYQWGSLAVLIGGRSFLWCDIPRNDRFIAQMLAAEEEFWWRIENRQPPEPDASHATAKALSALFPKDELGEMVNLAFPEAVEWDTELAAAKAAIKALDEKVTLNENRLKAAIGNNVGAVLPNGAVYTWKHQKRAGYTVAPTEFRVLRRRG